MYMEHNKNSQFVRILVEMVLVIEINHEQLLLSLRKYIPEMMPAREFLRKPILKQSTE